MGSIMHSKGPGCHALLLGKGAGALTTLSPAVGHVQHAICSVVRCRHPDLLRHQHHSEGTIKGRRGSSNAYASPAPSDQLRLLAHEEAGSFAKRPAIDALAGSAAVASGGPAWVDRPLQRGDRSVRNRRPGRRRDGPRLSGPGQPTASRRRHQGSPDVLATDPERRARFDREAHILATLNGAH
jgi:hypothetical protein